MAIPLTVSSLVQDLLRILNVPGVEITNKIETAYQRALTELARETDFFASEQDISAIADLSIYTAAAGTTRILAALHNRTLLRLVSSRSLDLLTSWQTFRAGEPEEWVQDKLPPGLDGVLSISPLNFAVHPAPEIDGASWDKGITLIRMGLPVNDDPPSWMYPYLIYKTVSIFTGESTEDRDPQASEWFGALADVWKQLLLM